MRALKTIAVKYFAVFAIFILISACAQINPQTSAGNGIGNLNHAALTEHHENLARSMQAKAEEQKRIINNRSRFSKFGRNARNAKNRILWRIDNYEKAAEMNYAKAAYHKKIAQQQAGREVYTNSEKNREQIDKARFNFDKKAPVNTSIFEDAL